MALFLGLYDKKKKLRFLMFLQQYFPEPVMWTERSQCLGLGRAPMGLIHCDGVYLWQRASSASVCSLVSCDLSNTHSSGLM